jgi:dipeptidyl aminopeptidase/acylaminoacyl peptidase
MKLLFTLLLLPLGGIALAQKLDTLTIEKIMRDPKWMGVAPSNIRWSDDSKNIYFNWNPNKTERDELFAITPANTKPVLVSKAEQFKLPVDGEWNKKHTLKLYEKNCDLYLSDTKNGKIQQLTNTVEREANPTFSGDDSKILFTRGENLFSLKPTSGELVQINNFTHSAGALQTVAAVPTGRRGAAQAATGTTQATGNVQERWLKDQQLELFDIIKVKEKDRKLDLAEAKAPEAKKLREIAVGDQLISGVVLSPDGRYVSYTLTKRATDAKSTIVPNYVTASGFTEDIPNRTKVGAPLATSETFIFDTQRDPVYKIAVPGIPGIKDIPAFFKDYPKELEARTKRNEDRKVTMRAPFWNEDGKYAVVVVTAQDNKDRWIMKLDAATGNLSLIDREHNDAWVGGPGSRTLGWLDNTRLYYQSEASGYSHIYIADVVTSAKKQLTNGNWEVQTIQLSKDKKTFYITANIEHPGITHFYRVPVAGGAPVKITTMKGGNVVFLSPDEKWLAINYSFSNKPGELYLQANKAGAKPVQITRSLTEEFKSYPWREPEVISFKNRYGSDVYARLYQPKKADPAKPAVVFVHGAGYLQNVHYWWSTYFREYMFHNMLADNGYTVLDIDYSGSSGYGRDWRTAIYRHMGGKDLTDQVDGVKLLVDKYGVNPKHVGLYGGSYGGFITLMAMFNEPEVFAAGGAIRSVTDWAHYNHGYTANILNEPYNDEKAYRQSSPIYFANGLKGNLLMLHGMVDVNVNYQDIIRLTQKLIELHKENWELASYPVEDHAFVQPSSWTDEYKRIYKLFEQTLKR